MITNEERSQYMLDNIVQIRETLGTIKITLIYLTLIVLISAGYIIY